MGCVPAVKDDVMNVATPPAFKAIGAPRFVPLSLNCTVPLGVPAPDVTVAVKVTLWPKLDGFTEASSAVIVLAFAIVKVCGTLGAALKFALPGCAAVIVHEPAPVRWTVLPANVQLPVALKLTLKPEEAVALTLKLWPQIVLLAEALSVVVLFAFAIVKVCGTSVAALKFALPGCDAVMVHEPAPVR